MLLLSGFEAAIPSDLDPFGSLLTSLSLMRSIIHRAVLALGVLVSFAGLARAQSIGDINTIPRIYGPAARMGNDEPFSHRYGFGVGPQFNINGDARQLWYQDYLDRLDRAERFGYCPPSGPRHWPAAKDCRPRIFGGAGFGLFSH
jgi:hypothetical protein